jgi:hypothetical protein
MLTIFVFEIKGKNAQKVKNRLLWFFEVKRKTIYIYIYNYRRYRFGLLGLISVALMNRMKIPLMSHECGTSNHCQSVQTEAVSIIYMGMEII